MKKLPKIALWVLILISVVVTVLYFLYKGDKGTPALDSWTATYLNWAYIMIAIAILSVILLPLLTIKERKFNIKSLLVLVVLAAVVIGGSYLLAPGGQVTLANGNVFDGLTTKWTDTGIFVCYILLALAFLSILGGSVYQAIRKD